MKKKTWNQYVIKKENKLLVLETIIQKAPISRTDIAGLTGLNKGTVSSLVSELLEEELIKESGPGESSGGRRPVMLHFNELAGYSIGIDLGVNYILGVITDLNGNICSEKQIHFAELTYEEIIERLYRTIDHLINSAPKSFYGIVGIGIGIPGIVNKDKKIILAPNLHWKNVELKSLLENNYNVPVTIDNEANAGAYGEMNFGIGKNYNDIVYVSVGMGIGVGLILNGQLYRGSNGFSGELGHMTIKVNGTKCTCGNTGCWELYASEYTLLKNSKHYLKYFNNRYSNLSLETIMELAENGNTEAIKSFEQVGKYIAVGVNNIINIFNPEQVIIGNRMAIAEKWISEPLNNYIKNQTLSFSQSNVKVDFSNLLAYSTVLGVASFSVEKFLFQKNF